MNKLTYHGEVAHGTVTFDNDGFTITYRHSIYNKGIRCTYIDKYFDSESVMYTYYFNQYENLSILLKTLNAEHAKDGYHVSALGINEIVIYKDAETTKSQELFWAWYVDQNEIIISHETQTKLVD